MTLEEQQAYLDELQMMHDQEQIADDEMKELLEDLARNVMANKLTDEMNLKSNILKTIDALVKFL